MGFGTGTWAFYVKKNHGPIRSRAGAAVGKFGPALPRPCPVAHRWAPPVVPTREISPSAPPLGFRVPARGC
jgi:hypothetical protein